MAGPNNYDGGTPDTMFGVVIPKGSGAPGSSPDRAPQIPVNSAQTVMTTDTASGASQSRYPVHVDSTSTGGNATGPAVEAISGVHLTGSGAGKGTVVTPHHLGESDAA
jgi:hypothetical protein